jgi:predicted membrane protein
MRDWTVRRLLALFLLVGLAIFSARVLLALFFLGGLLVCAAVIFGVALFARWRGKPASAGVPSRPPSSSFA